jgi:enoyl-CoA hydratase/carnithine racemase
MSQTVTFAGGRLVLDTGRIARLTIAAPERRNAIGQAMWAAIPDICARVAADDDCRVLVVAARPGPSGPVFSAGADIAEFAEVYATPDSTAAYNGLVRAAQSALRELPRPVIAEIAGACVGGGCGLALSSDLRFAARGARFGITTARLGLAYSYEDTAQLVAAVGPSRAKDLLFSGRLIEAEEALVIGLIDRLLPDPGALAQAVAEYAEALAGLSPASIRAAKAMVNAITAPDPARAAAQSRLFEATFAGPDFAAGRAAFLARRPPRF